MTDIKETLCTDIHYQKCTVTTVQEQGLYVYVYVYVYVYMHMYIYIKHRSAISTLSLI